MAQKISPISFRVGFQRGWLSRWFSLKKYKNLLEEDVKIRDFLKNKLKNMSVDKVEIERSPDTLTIIVHTARPGLIIGVGGTGIEDLKRELKKVIKRKV